MCQLCLKEGNSDGWKPRALRNASASRHHVVIENSSSDTTSTTTSTTANQSIDDPNIISMNKNQTPVSTSIVEEEKGREGAKGSSNMAIWNKFMSSRNVAATKTDDVKAAVAADTQELSKLSSSGSGSSSAGGIGSIRLPDASAVVVELGNKQEIVC